MSKSSPSVRKVGWLIWNRKKNCIWKQSYSSKEEATQELTNQIRMIQKTRPTFTGSDWKIESFEYFTSEKGAEDFKDFEHV